MGVIFAGIPGRNYYGEAVKVTEFPIRGPKLIEVATFFDSRGFFTERFQRERFQNLDLPAEDFMQDNFSRSAYRVLRGLHYQFQPAQGKLVTALNGRIHDVVVDIRRDSETFGQWLSVELDGSKPAWFWVPAGFAHGFVVTSEAGADVMYKVNASYSPSGEAGIVWNDKDLNIQWPFADPLLSGKDAMQGSWQAYLENPKF